MKINRLLAVTLALASIASITVFMGPQEAFATTVIDANDIPAPSQTVDFSQFAGVFDCPGVGLIGPDAFCFGIGPIQVGDLVLEDITWSSTSIVSVIGNGDYGLGPNGDWDIGRNGYVGLNAGLDTDVMRFDFNDGLVCAVGAFVNHGSTIDPYVIRVLDNGNAVLETFNVGTDAPINTPGATNDGAFRGIVRASNDIAAIELSSGFNVLDDLKFSRNCDNIVGGELIPIDSTSLLLAGLSGVQSLYLLMVPAIVVLAGTSAFFAFRNSKNS